MAKKLYNFVILQGVGGSSDVLSPPPPSRSAHKMHTRSLPLSVEHRLEHSGSDDTREMQRSG